MLIYFQLVAAGYGTLREVKQMTAREVIQALFYEKYKHDYQNAYMELNSGS